MHGGRYLCVNQCQCRCSKLSCCAACTSPFGVLPCPRDDIFTDIGDGGKGYDCTQHNAAGVTKCNAAKDDKGARVCKFEDLSKECQSFDPCMEAMDETKCKGTTGCSWMGTCSREGSDNGDGAGGDEGGCHPESSAAITLQRGCFRACMWLRMHQHCTHGTREPADHACVCIACQPRSRICAHVIVLS